MALNSKQKGNRGETIIRDKLRELTGIKFERVPASGALPYLKGDLFVPNQHSLYCIECKNYEESCINDTILTNKSNKILEWWPKLLLDCKAATQEPLLIVKYNRSKIFVVTQLRPMNTDNFLYYGKLGLYILLLDEWISKEKIHFVK